MRICAVILLVFACGTAPQASETTKPAEVILSETQVQCRSVESLELGRLNIAYGPSCDKPTMPLALVAFDLGTMSGEGAATDFRFALTNLCLCNVEPCSDSVQIRAMNEVAAVPENRDHAEASGVSRIMAGHASHSCLDGTIAAEIFKLGFRCGYLTAIDSPSMRRKMAATFQKMFTDDLAKADKFADVCWKPVPVRSDSPQ